ncbi:hypothetical protein HS088_TW20G00336 [Tripterygium wilfordii]|uniref:DUF4005 domain-containing protein n=1 Tax=Tripterygium wilfordii TaxID=458696 RepID=A0A7J7C7Z9_TRIWF|nr:protein IQ-DOMAIN 14 [Tripterygium wilfordii]KAF5729967.1 hypothetical protein HS088_TW20G00336 [Tripterygium wilfordii]
MGKATRWFRAILGLKKSDTPSSQSTTARSKEKRRWSFVKSYRERENHIHNNATAKTGSLYAPEAVTIQEYEKKDEEEDDANNHAIAVAEATAAVAEAAVAAAHAAAEVVRLTSSGRCTTNNHLMSYASGNLGVPTGFEASAVKIQAVFRGYLARKALRALKGLVRLQALVRGHIERKRTADWLHRMQALMRAQARARAGRVMTVVESSHSSSKSSHLYQPGPPTPEKFERLLRAKGTNCERPSLLKKNGSKSTGRVIVDQDKPQSAPSWSDQTDERLCDQRRTSTRSKSVDDENCDKILEIDHLKSHLSKRKNLFHSSPHLAVASEQYSRSFTASKDTTTHQTVQSSSSCEVQSVSSMKLPIHDVDEGEFCTAENSPQFLTASSRGGCSRSPFTTPTKSDASISYLSEFSDHPNYMSYTESSKAKVRSLSAPKQRPQYERSSSTKRYSIHGFGELRYSAQRTSALQANFASKGYPGSGRLDRLGMPVGYKY